MAIENNPVDTKSSPERSRIKSRFIKISIVIVAILLIPLSYGGYLFAVSPNSIRYPQMEHYHFRMQIIVDGKAENFAEQKYQTGYQKDLCNANLPEQPIHFHDNKDQFTHIHWEGVTGGMVLKYYGWNFIGGLDNALGYKLDDLTNIQKVTTHGNYLPTVSDKEQLYVYTGDENGYKERSLDEFTTQDLEKFFGKQSNMPLHTNPDEVSLLDRLFPTAAAHGGVDDGNDGEPGEETEQEKLTRINNLLGNVVIFAQKDKPSDQQIKDKFNNLEPLTDSTCGG